MLALLRNLDTSLYTHRSYIVSEGDEFSCNRAKDFEASLEAQRIMANGQDLKEIDFEIETVYDVSVIPRARKIHQSLLTTPISALHCLISCFHVLYAPQGKIASSPRYPDLIITNGPGTAVCVVWASLLLRFIGAGGTQGRMRTIYVESWARVKRLSLSGKLLAKCVDRFFVQWEGLKGAGGRAEYLGVLI